MMYAGLHNPTTVRVNHLDSGTAALNIVDGKGGEMIIFTTPAIAQGMADAFNANRAPEPGTASPINGDE